MTPESQITPATEQNSPMTSSIISTGSDFQESADFLEGRSQKSSVIIGSSRGKFGQWVRDVIKHREKSKYYGRVLCPEEGGTTACSTLSNTT